MRTIFRGSGIELSFGRTHLQLDPDIQVSEATEFYLSSFGPLIKARELLEPQGRWQSLANELRSAIEGMLLEPAEYMVVTGTKDATTMMRAGPGPAAPMRRFDRAPPRESTSTSSATPMRGAPPSPPMARRS